LAVANSLAAVMAGAGQVECTINGLGERAGNCSLEEVVMAMRTRKDLFGAITNINAKEIMRSSRLVSDVTGIQVQPNKAIVGANAFAHEAGIHQHGMLANARTYEIMDPADVGVAASKLVLGIHSGKHAIMRKLIDMGYELDDEKLDKVVQRVKEVAGKKKEVTERDLESIVTDEVTQVEEQFHLDYLQVIAGTQITPTTTVRIVKNGEEITSAGVGAGSVDSVYQTIAGVAKLEHTLVDYIVHSVTGGTDALAEVTVRVAAPDGHVITGRGAHNDVILASARAYVQALNRLAGYQPSESPQSIIETV
jgi:2-isopropylmalate synthase